MVCIWQGQKESNPRHAVLETAALPAELYPYMTSGPRRSKPRQRPGGLSRGDQSPLKTHPHGLAVP